MESITNMRTVTYKKDKKTRQNMIKKVSLYIFSICVLCLIIVMIINHIITPNQVTVSAKGSMVDESTLNNFNGNMFSKDIFVISADSFNSTASHNRIVNQTSILMNIDNQKYRLDPGEFQIRLGDTGHLATDAPIQVQAVNATIEKLLINNFEPPYPINKYIIGLSNVGELPLDMVLYEQEFSFNINGDYELMIKDTVYPFDSLMTIQIENADPQFHTILKIFDVKDIQLMSAGDISFKGTVSNAFIPFNSGNLILTENIDDKEITLDHKTIEIKGYKDGPLKFEFSALYTEMDYSPNEIELSGIVSHESKIQNKAIIPNVSMVIQENRGEIYAGIIITLFCSLITYIISAGMLRGKNLKKE